MVRRYFHREAGGEGNQEEGITSKKSLETKRDVKRQGWDRGQRSNGVH